MSTRETVDQIEIIVVSMVPFTI